MSFSYEAMYRARQNGLASRPKVILQEGKDGMNIVPWDNSEETINRIQQGLDEEQAVKDANNALGVGIKIINVPRGRK